MTSRARLLVGAIAAIGLLAASAALIGRWNPAMPSGAGRTLRATVAVIGAPRADLPEGSDAAAVGALPVASNCLDRIVEAGSYADLCWGVRRNVSEADPQQDYYMLQITGTFGAEHGSAPRWALVRSRLTKAPSNNVFDGWPAGAYEGDCNSIDVTGLALPQSAPLHGELCGTTVGDVDPMNWVQTLTWRCVGCLLPDQRDRALSMYQEVAVPEGETPVWELYADIGS